MRDAGTAIGVWRWAHGVARVRRESRRSKTLCGGCGQKKGVDILTARRLLHSVMLSSEAIHIAIIGEMIILCRRPGHGDMA